MGLQWLWDMLSTFGTSIFDSFWEKKEEAALRQRAADADVAEAKLKSAVEVEAQERELKLSRRFQRAHPPGAADGLPTGPAQPGQDDHS
jgi:hypothetical protein